MKAPPATRWGDAMRSFWDRKAREDAHFYIATWLGYRQPRGEEFFMDGAQIVALLREHGYEPLPGSAILEIGCGIGRMTRGFAEVFGSVDAIDVSPEMVRRARENLAQFPHARVHEADGVSLAQFADATFDFGFSYIVFQHIPEFAIVRSYILETARVLKPGGTFLFQVNNLPPGREHRWAGLRLLSRLWRRHGRHALLELAARLRRGPRGFDHPAWLGHSVRRAELIAALADAGLEVRSQSGEGTQYFWTRAVKPPGATPNAG